MTARLQSRGASPVRGHRADANVPSRPRDTGPYSYSSNIDSETGRARIVEVEIETAVSRRSRPRQTERFLRGPIPLRQIAAAARLPGQALAVFLAIHHRQALTKNPTVKLPRRLLDELGVTKDAKARALRALEAAGLVHVDRQPGRTPTITIKTRGETDEADS